MTIRQKPKKSPLTSFVSMIVPDRIEEAFDRVDEYFTEHLKLSFETPEGVTGVLNELIRDHGEPIRNALYALLCDPDNKLRKMVPVGLEASGRAAAVGVLVPALVAQFALAPAVALLVATLVIDASAANAQKTVCEGMVLQHKKVARGIRAREHAAATSAKGKSPRRPLAGAGLKKDGAARKKTSGGKPPQAKPTPANRPDASKPSPKSVRKPYPKTKNNPNSEQ
jgi:hypothetical protein